MAGNKEKLKEIEIPVSTRVLVVGSGPIAAVAALELAKTGHEVLLCSPGPEVSGNAHLWMGSYDNPLALESMIEETEADPRIHVMTSTKVLDLEGAPGDFRVRLDADGDTGVEERVGAVILSNEPLLKTTFKAWGVGESEKMRSLSWLESSPSSPLDKTSLPGDLPLTAVFLSGFTHHSNPFLQRRAFEAASALASKKENQVFFITEHFKVAHTGMERLTRKARESGVLLVKLTDNRPHIQSEVERITVSYFDESLGDEVALHPDLVILEEAPEAPEEAADLADRLGITLDQSGFLQGDNIYHRPIYTNRTGIWVVGSAKGPVSLEQGIEEAKAAIEEIHRLLGQGDTVTVEQRLLFNEARCGRCLTCYRLCPHRAISCVTGKPTFYDLACQACGICAAGCPADAIQIAGFTDDEITWHLEKMLPVRSGQDRGDSLQLVAFCCENSAFEVARLSRLRGCDLPEGLKLVKVPCAGRVDLEYLFKAFDLGADGVMLLSCHPEACKSVTGNTLARQRVEMVREALKDVGLEKERLFFGSLGPGMISQFMAMVKDMEQTLREMGESPVRAYLRQSAIDPGSTG